MSDFLTGLRADLMEAAAREAAASAPRRARRRIALTFRPALVAGAIAAAAVTFFLGALLARIQPEPRPATLRVAEKLRVGGTPQDAVIAGGALWVLDLHGRLIRATHGRRVLRTPSNAAVLDTADGRVWALGQLSRDGYWLFGADARTGGRVEQATRRGFPEGMTVGETGIWIGNGTFPRAAARVTGRRVRVPIAEPSYLAAGGGTVWGLGDEGAMYGIDERSAKVVLQIPQLVDPVGSPGSGGHLLAADTRGVWVGDPGHDRVVRVTRRGVERWLRVGPLPGPIAVRGNTLWVATGDPAGETYRLKRVDLRSGEVRGSIALGANSPEALAPFAGGCWVVASDGTAFRIDTR